MGTVRSLRQRAWSLFIIADHPLHSKHGVFDDHSTQRVFVNVFELDADLIVIFRDALSVAALGLLDKIV
jgi:hypothetical protein